MNRPVARVYGLVIVLFALLIAFTSRWSVFEAEALRANTDNHRVVLEEQQIKRGLIRAADGTLLAANRSLPGKRFERRYPEGSLFGRAVGFDSFQYGRSGLERFYNDALTGRSTALVSTLESILKPKQVGDDLRTSLDPDAQRVAIQQLGGRQGAVVALDIKSGAVKVMAATPSFDPDRPTRNQLDLATQGLFPPGSTFKTLTAAAALDTGRYTPDSMIDGKDDIIVSGTPLKNFGGETFGDITLTFALTHSVNTVFAQVGEKLGRSTMADYMERFGFDAKPPVDLPEGQLSTSGSYRDGKLLKETSGVIDTGRRAIGQDKLLVTPLQMASVAQTIANDGVRMKPRLVDRVTDPDGRTVASPADEEAERVMSKQSADQLTDMMRQVVREGTGTAAALSGVPVAGKTGTAEIDIARGINDLWFIGFAGDDAIAVVIAKQQGQGGTVAAPVAKAVLEALGA